MKILKYVWLILKIFIKVSEKVEKNKNLVDYFNIEKLKSESNYLKYFENFVTAKISKFIMFFEWKFLESCSECLAHIHNWLSQLALLVVWKTKAKAAGKYEIGFICSGVSSCELWREEDQHHAPSICQENLHSRYLVGDRNYSLSNYLGPFHTGKSRSRPCTIFTSLWLLTLASAHFFSITDCFPQPQPVWVQLPNPSWLFPFEKWFRADHRLKFHPSCQFLKACFDRIMLY